MNLLILLQGLVNIKEKKIHLYETLNMLLMNLIHYAKQIILSVIMKKTKQKGQTTNYEKYNKEGFF